MAKPVTKTDSPQIKLMSWDNITRMKRLYGDISNIRQNNVIKSQMASLSFNNQELRQECAYTHAQTHRHAQTPILNVPASNFICVDFIMLF